MGAGAAMDVEGFGMGLRFDFIGTWHKVRFPPRLDLDSATAMFSGSM